MRIFYVFKTPFYQPKYKEFYNFDELKKFLQSFNFMQPHFSSNIPTGLPEFQLGCCFGLKINGDFCKSEIKWGPKFIVGRNVRKDENGKVFITVPMDVKGNQAQQDLVFREYKEIRFNKNMADAIIDLDSLRQIWPKRKKTKTELVRFFMTAAKLQRKGLYR